MTDFVAQIPDSFHKDCERCMAAALGDDVESFHWGSYEWDVAKGRQIASDGRKPIDFQTHELTSLLMLRGIEEAHVDHVPVDEPVLVVRFPVTNHASQRGLFPIDGSHRIARRARLGHLLTQAYVLSEAESDAIRTDPSRPKPQPKGRQRARAK